MATEEEKVKSWKGHSRVQHVCHWCTKKEKDSNSPKFQACSACKEVIYCSKECQKKSWPLHKKTCKLNKDSRDQIEKGSPEYAKNVHDIKKWHGLNIQRLVAAIVCALNLGDEPFRINNHALYLGIERKPNHESLPAHKKFDPSEGFVLTDEEFRQMLGRQLGGQAIIESGKEANEMIQKKGAVGVASIMLQYKDNIDIVRVIIPHPKVAKSLQDSLQWGERWVDGLRLAIESGFGYDSVTG